MFRTTSALLLAVLAASVCGCEAPAPATTPTLAGLRISDRDAFFDSTQTLLRELDLPPARVDRETGVLATTPTTSGQWFEFWRADSRGGYQVLENSLHTIRRTVTVALARPEGGKAGGDEYQLSVEVQKERYSAPERQVTTASGALAIYNERLPTEEGLRGAASRGAHWVPLGRDVRLEEYLLDRIIERAARAPATQPSAAQNGPELRAATP